MHGGRIGGAAERPALCPAWGTQVWFKPSPREGLGGGGGRVTPGEAGSCPWVRGCSEPLLTGQISGSGGPLQRCCHGASLQQRQKGYGVHLAPTPLPGNAFAPLWAQAGAEEGHSRTISLVIDTSWVGVSAPQGTPATAPAWGSHVKLKGHIQIGDCPGAVPGRGSRQLLGYLGHWAGCRRGCPQSHQERCPSRGRAQQGAELTTLALKGLFYFLLMTFLFSLGISTG